MSVPSWPRFGIAEEWILRRLGRAGELGLVVRGVGSLFRFRERMVFGSRVSMRSWRVNWRSVVKLGGLF